MKSMKVAFRVALFVCLLILSSNVAYGKTHKHRKQGSKSMPSPKKSPQRPTPISDEEIGGSTSNSMVFDVMKYGAKGNGVVDDTNAFVVAWTNACKVQGSTILIPSGFVFLVKPVSFSGHNCQSKIVFQVDGKIIAPNGSGSWKSGLLQWLEFTELNSFRITGKGVIDGQGSVWWNNYSTMKFDGKMPNTKPTAVRFYGSTDVTVTGVTIQNSPQTHLKFDNCIGVQVFGISISSPGDTPNTDGIHLQNSQDVLIHTTSMSCGDDCISIQTGCSRVYIHDVSCGPGHGISISGLGRDSTKACVSNVTVRDTTFTNTMTGVRIKTWQGGSGMVQGITFSNIQVSQVETPIIIDQYYCNGNRCGNKTSAVSVSGVSYQAIKGTYTANPVRFACSDSMPCDGITLAGIELSPTTTGRTKDDEGPFCWKAYGKLQTATTPAIGCLMAEADAPSVGKRPSGSC